MSPRYRKTQKTSYSRRIKKTTSANGEMRKADRFVSEAAAAVAEAQRSRAV